MTIGNRDLEVGTKLVAHYHKQEFTCDVIEGEKGGIAYRLSDGKVFKSPSTAGVSITGKKCNGWVFWSLATDTTVEVMKEKAEPKAEKKETAPEDEGFTVTRVEPVKQATPVKSKCIIRKLSNQSRVGKDETLWRCDTCGLSFKAPKGVVPTSHS